jgi:hypothetical protein
MDEMTLKNYSFSELSTFIKIVEPLADRNCLSVYNAICYAQERASGCFHFNELTGLFCSEDGGMETILSKLVDSGLVYKKAARPADLGDRELAYYEPSEIGKRIIHGILDYALSNNGNKKSD